MSTIAPVPLINYFSYLFDSANWHFGGDSSIPDRIVQHLLYTIVALVISAAIALPLGLLIGHTNRGAVWPSAWATRALAADVRPAVLLLVTFVGVGLVPVLVALMVLAIPPILAQTYAGITSVDRSAVDAAVGMGMRSKQVLFLAELPMALPLIISGLRSALLQVCATATIAAYAGLGGLGRLLIDGLNRNDYAQIFAGAVLVGVARHHPGLLERRRRAGRGVARRARATRPARPPARRPHLRVPRRGSTRQHLPLTARRKVPSMHRFTKLTAAAAVAAILPLSACGSDPTSGGGTGSSSSPAITIGSANFPENQLLAEMYAQALEAKEVKVTRKFNIGARELYLKALKDGSIDMIPEYNGAFLAALSPNGTVPARRHDHRRGVPGAEEGAARRPGDRDRPRRPRTRTP